MSNAYVCSRAVKCSTMSAAFLQTILCRTNISLDSLATAIAWNLLFVWMIKIFQISQNLFTSLVYPELLHSLAFSRLLRNLAREQIHSYANSPPKHQISELWMVNINENGLKNQFYLMVFWQNTMVLWIILCEQLVISMQMVTVITREKPRKYVLVSNFMRRILFLVNVFFFYIPFTLLQKPHMLPSSPFEINTERSRHL